MGFPPPAIDLNFLPHALRYCNEEMPGAAHARCHEPSETLILQAHSPSHEIHKIIDNQGQRWFSFFHLSGQLFKNRLSKVYLKPSDHFEGFQE
jgi:hypothetical protein